MKLDMIATLTLAGMVLFLGYGLRRRIPALARLNIPAPVIGGLLFAIAMLLARTQAWPVPEFDTTLQRPLMVAFFATVGFSASLSLLRTGGPQVAAFLLLATAFAIAQNLAGMAIAAAFGLPPLLGVLAGSVTLTGGPATGLAFAPLFEQAGIAGAGSIAIASGMAGIVLGGLVGGPIGTWLITRGGLRGQRSVAGAPGGALQAPPDDAPGEDGTTGYLELKTVVIVLAAMWIGVGISALIAASGLTLPEYIGAMLASAALRAIDDRWRVPGLSHRALDTLGAVSLSLFLVMALMTLDLRPLAGLALPLLVILAVQVLLVALVCVFVVFRAMGRDYDAAVMSGGFAGFMLGTTANAMAVMRALVERAGAAPRAFIVAPLVGAFFIDFTNALVITAFLNLAR